MYRGDRKVCQLETFDIFYSKLNMKILTIELRTPKLQEVNVEMETAGTATSMFRGAISGRFTKINASSRGSGRLYGLARKAKRSRQPDRQDWTSFDLSFKVALAYLQFTIEY